MAWLQQNEYGQFHVSFRFGGKKYKRSLHTDATKEAQASVGQLEQTLRMVKLGLLAVPSDADVPQFLLSGGRTIHRSADAAPRLTLRQLFTVYFDAMPPGSLEPSTLQGMKIHQRHLERLLGADREVPTLTKTDLQSYVNRRAKEKGRRGLVTTTTIKMAVITLRTLWNWAVSDGKLAGQFPNRGLMYPKSKEKEPFRTRAEIERMIARGVPEARQKELWDSLFLTKPEIDELLAYSKTHARHAVLYAMIAFAAHTGARRSEIVRSQVADLDFEGESITLRERKKSHDKTTTRRVPMSTFLAKTLKEWLAEHPGGPDTFALPPGLARSKNKSDKPRPVSREEAFDHFKRTLANSKWSVLRGWHVLRHSFISNLAMNGVDERLLDAFSGHTSEIRKRYIHLIPAVASKAIKSVFG